MTYIEFYPSTCYSMDQQLRLAEDEAQEYQAFLQKLENETEDDNRVLELESELEKLQMEESSLQKELQVRNLQR